MALLDLQDMAATGDGEGHHSGGNSSLSLLCHSSHSITICL